jgi:3-oxoacyl-[acyl-carrier-protein] synthase II
MGMVTCLGPNVSANWQAVTAGRSGIGPITLFDAARFNTRIAGEVKDIGNADGLIEPRELRRLDRHQQFAIVATAEAINQSGLVFPPADPYRCGAVIGSGMGGLQSIEDNIELLKRKGPRGVNPLVIPKTVINLAPGILSIKYGFKGPNFGVVNACTSGTSAIGEAYRAIREGRTDVMIAGGTEAVVTELSVASFSALRALSRRNDDPGRASRPFDSDRDGFVISEGAGIMILESHKHANERGAQPIAEIVGFGATDDGYHMVMPDPEGEGAYRAMRFALEDADVRPEQVQYVNAHGTSTELNDRMETVAIKRLFGPHSTNLAISSTKSMTGHLIGAAGAVEAIYSVLTILHGVIPPTINLDNPDPECDLDYTPRQAVHKEVRYALSNSFAFGGQNASLLFRCMDGNG